MRLFPSNFPLNRSKDNLGTGLWQDGRPPREQAFCLGVQKLTIVVEDDLA